MSQPLLAEGRMILPYTVDGLPHKMFAYLRNPQPVGGTYNVNSRTLDANDQPWKNCAEAWFQSVSYLFSGTLTASGDILLQRFIDNVWQPTETYTPVTSNAAGSYKPGTQVTVVLRDSAFKQIKIVMLETSEISPQHFIQIAGGDAAFDNMIKQFTSTATISPAPYIFMVSRGNRYINTTPFIGATVTLNRKVRRARGLT